MSVTLKGSKWVARLRLNGSEFVVGVCGSREAAEACLSRHQAAVADGSSPYLIPGALSLKHYAESIGVRYGTAKRWVHEGMPSHKADAAVLIVPGEAEAWIREHARNVTFSRRGIVYFIEREGDGAIKIGWTSDIRRRLLELEKLVGRQLVLLGAVPGDKVRELEFHARFAESLIGDEWFRPTDDLRAFINSLGRMAA